MITNDQKYFKPVDEQIRNQFSSYNHQKSLSSIRRSGSNNQFQYNPKKNHQNYEGQYLQMAQFQQNQGKKKIQIEKIKKQQEFRYKSIMVNQLANGAFQSQDNLSRDQRNGVNDREDEQLPNIKSLDDINHFQAESLDSQNQLFSHKVFTPGRGDKPKNTLTSLRGQVRGEPQDLMASVSSRDHDLSNHVKSYDSRLPDIFEVSSKQLRTRISSTVFQPAPIEEISASISKIVSLEAYPERIKQNNKSLTDQIQNYITKIDTALFEKPGIQIKVQSPDDENPISPRTDNFQQLQPQEFNLAVMGSQNSTPGQVQKMEKFERFKQVLKNKAETGSESRENVKNKKFKIYTYQSKNVPKNQENLQFIKELIDKKQKSVAATDPARYPEDPKPRQKSKKGRNHYNKTKTPNLCQGKLLDQYLNFDPNKSPEQDSGRNAAQTSLQDIDTKKLKMESLVKSPVLSSRKSHLRQLKPQQDGFDLKQQLKIVIQNSRSKFPLDSAILKQSKLQSQRKILKSPPKYRYKKDEDNVEVILNNDYQMAEMINLTSEIMLNQRPKQQSPSRKASPAKPVRIEIKNGSEENYKQASNFQPSTAIASRLQKFSEDPTPQNQNQRKKGNGFGPAMQIQITPNGVQNVISSFSSLPSIDTGRRQNQEESDGTGSKEFGYVDDGNQKSIKIRHSSLKLIENCTPTSIKLKKVSMGISSDGRSSIESYRNNLQAKHINFGEKQMINKYVEGDKVNLLPILNERGKEIKQTAKDYDTARKRNQRSKIQKSMLRGRKNALNSDLSGLD